MVRTLGVASLNGNEVLSDYSDHDAVRNHVHDYYLLTVGNT